MQIDVYVHHLLISAKYNVWLDVRVSRRSVEEALTFWEP